MNSSLKYELLSGNIWSETVNSARHVDPILKKDLMICTMTLQNL